MKYYYFICNIKWVPYEAGGRKNPIKLIGNYGTPYCPLIDLKDKNNSWSLKIMYSLDLKSTYVCSFLADCGPVELIKESGYYDLFEGIKRVATIHVEKIVCIELDNTYTLNSTDNKYIYNILLNPGNHKEYYSCIHIKTTFEDKNSEFDLIGNKLPLLNNDNVIFENNNIIINTSNEIIKINMYNIEIVKYLRYEDYIYYIKKIDENRFIVYGEQYIRMLDNNLNEIWSFCGKDIFVSVSNKNPFQISDNMIKLYDYKDNYYELDFDGNQIK